MMRRSIEPPAAIIFPAIVGVPYRHCQLNRLADSRADYPADDGLQRSLRSHHPAPYVEADRRRTIAPRVGITLPTVASVP